MRCGVYLLVCAAGLAQVPDPAYAPLTKAYAALQTRDYDGAIAGFLEGLRAAPERPSIYKDLGYTYLKVGENELARDQFRAAMRLDPADTQVAMEYAFLCYEAKEQAQARRIFDRIRKTGNSTAEEAFRNIDGPLAAGIERWKEAIAKGADNFSAHFELASLADQRDDWALAAEHYEKAWRLIPERRSVLVELGRVWRALGRSEDSMAALLAASRGGEPRAAELAREQLPDRYPYIAEFRRALQLDPANGELRRELGYLLLRMDRAPEAEAEFRILAESSSKDLLAATQLGFLLYARGERAEAQRLFDRVLAGDDEDLANRVRAVLRMPQVLKTRAAVQPSSIDAKVMAERSIKAGYMKDALRYLQSAHESDPGDFDIMLKLGRTWNILHDDRQAFQWFNLARRSPDPQVATEADRAWRNLRSANEIFRMSGWIYPVFSTRWQAAFSYGQVRIESPRLSTIQPYVSVRFVGDSAVFVRQALSEQSFILSAGLSADVARGVRTWFEVGSAVGYVSRHMVPDYRGGLSMVRRFGRYTESSVDALYVSRFDKDTLLYDQTRIGRISGAVQWYWNANATLDLKRQYWANFVETGPGIRWTPFASSFVTVNLLRGVYLINEENPRRPNFFDIRAGIWYAFSH